MPEPFESGAVLVKSFEKDQAKFFCRGNFVSLREGPKMMAKQITCFRVAPPRPVGLADLPIRPVVPVEGLNLVQRGLDFLDVSGVPEVPQNEIIATQSAPVGEHIKGRRGT